jgi:CarD family transcriptional regulator
MATKPLNFDVGDYVVYPKHGVGKVMEVQSSEIAGMTLELYVLRFEKERMTLRVPTNKAESVGMRKLSSDKTMRDALGTLEGKPRVKRTMWSRAVRRNTRPRSIRATWCRSPRYPRPVPRRRPARAELFGTADLRGGVLAPGARAGGDGADRRAAALVKLHEILNAAAAIYNKDKVVTK